MWREAALRYRLSTDPLLVRFFPFGERCRQCRQTICAVSCEPYHFLHETALAGSVAADQRHGVCPTAHACLCSEMREEGLYCSYSAAFFRVTVSYCCVVIIPARYLPRMSNSILTFVPFFDSVEVGVVVRIGNYRHFETVVGRLADSKAYTVHRHRSFVNCDVSLCVPAPCRIHIRTYSTSCRLLRGHRCIRRSDPRVLERYVRQDARSSSWNVRDSPCLPA